MYLNAIALPRSIFSFLLVLSLLFCFQPAAVAQTGTVGTLTGVVKDPQGANLPGVSVVVKNIATGATRTAVTNGEGHWTLPGLPIGAYEVSYEITGFKKLVRDRVFIFSQNRGSYLTAEFVRNGHSSMGFLVISGLF